MFLASLREKLFFQPPFEKPLSPERINFFSKTFRRPFRRRKLLIVGGFSQYLIVITICKGKIRKNNYMKNSHCFFFLIITKGGKKRKRRRKRKERKKPLSIWKTIWNGVLESESVAKTSLKT